MALLTRELLTSDPTVTATLAVARLIADAALIALVGALVLCLLLPNQQGVLTDIQRRWLSRARLAAVVLWVATAVLALATAADVLAVSLPAALGDPQLVISLLTQTTLGTSLALQMLVGALFATVATLPRTPTAVILALIAPLIIIVARASTGHSGNSSWHMAAVEAWVFHIVGVTVWVGVVGAALWHLRDYSDHMPELISRLRPLASLCFITVVASGAVSAIIRVGRIADLATTTYGRLLLTKMVLVAAIAVIALRRRSAMNSVSSLLRRELLLMGVAVTASVALSRTAPPVDPDAGALASPTPARLELGFPLPPATSTSNLLWAVWRPEVLWGAVAVAAVAAYIMGVRRLRTRGDHWSTRRSIAWIAGWVVLVYATSGPLGVYGHLLFSAHMVQHLLLVMLVPILLVCGAPTTLALRALPVTTGGTGPREWLLSALRSRYLSMFGHPLVAFVNFIAGFFLLYFSPAFEWLMSSHAGHLVMQAHFLATGYLFFWVLIGVDPSPRRVPHPAKVGLAILAAPFHALFSVIIMQSDEVLANNYFAIFTDEFGSNPLRDQYTGAAFGWAFGEVPMVIVIVIAVTQWVRADARAAARFDRLDDARRARERSDSQ